MSLTIFSIVFAIPAWVMVSRISFSSACISSHLARTWHLIDSICSARVRGFSSGSFIVWSLEVSGTIKRQAWLIGQCCQRIIWLFCAKLLQSQFEDPVKMAKCLQRDQWDIRLHTLFSEIARWWISLQARMVPGNYILSGSTMSMIVSGSFLVDNKVDWVF